MPRKCANIFVFTLQVLDINFGALLKGVLCFIFFASLFFCGGGRLCRRGGKGLLWQGSGAGSACGVGAWCVRFSGTLSRLLSLLENKKVVECRFTSLIKMLLFC